MHLVVLFRFHLYFYRFLSAISSLAQLANQIIGQVLNVRTLPTTVASLAGDDARSAFECLGKLQVCELPPTWPNERMY